MGRAGRPMTGSPFGEDGTFEGAMKLYEGTCEPANDTLAIALGGSV